jgi:16S rRNA (cytosine967-C5)-methyltransferase
LGASAATTDPRRLAWQVLIAVEEGAFADAALGTALRATALAPRDRSLATQLVYGTLAWQGLLDQVIAQAGRSASELDVPIRAVLRLALFQLIRLDRVPEFAAVDTTVELSKEIKRGAASGLVNAVLRRFLRAGKRIDVPSREADLAGHLAVALSHPRWLVERWLNELGADDTAALLAADNEPAPTVVRVNRRRVDPVRLRDMLAERGVDVRTGTYADDALVLQSGGDPTALPGYREGWFVLQGEASQLVAAMLGVRAGARVLDVCAAPGGKAMAAAETVDVSGVVVAVDRRRSGLRHMLGTARRLALTRLLAVQADATSLPLDPTWTADAVLVDAPCSGLGTLRQHPEIRWRRRPEDIDRLAALQSRLLQAAARHVARDGALVYATCTLSSAENAEVIERFLDWAPEFVVEDPRPWLPVRARPLVDDRGFLRTFPHRHGLDGFFAARLKRSASLRMVRP